MKVNSAKVDVGASAEAETRSSNLSFNTVDYITNPDASQDQTSPVLMVSPELADFMGLNEAFIIQQIHYWTKVNEVAGRNFVDGRYWTYNTYEDWHKQFPFMSISTINRALKKLRDNKYIFVERFNKMNTDQTRWYAVNYQMVRDELKIYRVSKDFEALVTQNELIGEKVKMSDCNQKTIVNTKEKQKSIMGQQPACVVDRPPNVVVSGERTYGVERFHNMMDFVSDYIDRLYPTYRHKEHPSETRAKRAVFANKILACVDQLNGNGVEIEDGDMVYMLKHAVMYDKQYDPMIYLVTEPMVLGYWVAEEYGYEFIQGTDYDYGEYQ